MSHFLLVRLKFQEFCELKFVSRTTLSRPEGVIPLLAGPEAEGLISFAELVNSVPRSSAAEFVSPEYSGLWDFIPVIIIAWE